MRFSCQNCSAKYQIADDKVGGKTIRMKCRKCGVSLQVRPLPNGEGEHVPDGAEATTSVLPSASVPPSAEPTAAADQPSPAASSGPPAARPLTPTTGPGAPGPSSLPPSFAASPRAPSIPPPALPRMPLPSSPPGGFPLGTARLPSSPPLPGRPLTALPGMGGGPVLPLGAPRIPTGSLPPGLTSPVPVTPAMTPSRMAAGPTAPQAAPGTGELPFAEPTIGDAPTTRLELNVALGVPAEERTGPSAAIPLPSLSDPFALTRVKSEASPEPGAAPAESRPASDPLVGFEVAPPAPAALPIDGEATVVVPAPPMPAPLPPAPSPPDAAAGALPQPDGPQPSTPSAAPLAKPASPQAPSGSAEGVSTLLSAEDQTAEGLARTVADIRLEMAADAARDAAFFGAGGLASEPPTGLDPMGPAPRPANDASAEVRADLELEMLGDRERRRRPRGMHPMAWGLIAMCAALGGVAAWVFFGPSAPKPDPKGADARTEAAPSATATASAATTAAPAQPTAEPAAVDSAAAASASASAPLEAAAVAPGVNPTMLSSPGATSPSPATSAASNDRANPGKANGAPCDPRTDPFCSSVGGPDGGASGPGAGGSSSGLTPEQIAAVVGRNSGSVKGACLPLVQSGAVKVSVSLTVGPGGNVTSVSASGGGNNGAVVACVRSRVQGWTFPSSGGASQVSVPFQLISQN
ncbi:MAG: zinc-ribbon domain-containing protein [Deltaproteobacteria bacterium]|nr:zinc-ribbon domain-containing protein [Deltaproteobacteria bacterium]